MRICLVHEEYPEETNYGGIATYQKAMAEELVKEGHTVYVICRSLTHDNNYIENGVKIYRLFVRNTSDQVADYVSYREKVAKILFDFQEKNLIDIIEVPDWGAETIFFEQSRKIPLVVRLHTPLKVWLKYNKNDFGKVKNKMLEWESKMIKSANLVTCCSLALKKIIVKDFEIDSSDILVTPNPANITNFYRDSKIKKEDKLIFVGSLEERKGVCIFAQALNIVLKKYPNIKVEFIGKDTIRNKKNISTKELILDIINKKYHSNIKFYGQIPNFDLNKYLNRALVGIYPSLFDNFPYVVLESMATGLHIVGSKNSGMVEMLADNTSIYETNNVSDLAEKIMNKYCLAKKENVCTSNIKRVQEMYNPKRICIEMLNLYEDTINKYYGTKVSKEDLENVLSNVEPVKIKKYKREKGGVANLVFKVVTSKKIYIIKKYFYKYNFDLANELYKKYELFGVNIIKPINKKVIQYRGFNYNVFDYKKPSVISKKIDILSFKNILTCDRKVNQDNTIVAKCEKYYTFLKMRKSYNNFSKEDIDYVLNVAKNLIEMEIFKEKYLNHGDISKTNIIVSKNKSYLIDFDEVLITTPLYDFAVIIVKLCTKNNKINLEKYEKLKGIMKEKYIQYSDDDYKFAVEFYLCKILLEKYYLHQKGIIDLYCKRQLKDNYIKYLNMLKNIE